MKPPELDSILKRARLPEIPGESLEMFPRNIIRRMDRERERWGSSFSLSEHRTSAGSRLKRELQRFFPHLAWAFGLAACVIVSIALTLGHKSLKPETPAASDSLANSKLIGETLAMFPNRVRAIVQDERGLNLVLSDTDDVPVSAPIYVRICDGRHCSSLVTFSGQEIQIAGQKVTVLSDAHGGIILTGRHFVWSDTERMNPGNALKIEARNLGATAM